MAMSQKNKDFLNAGDPSSLGKPPATKPAPTPAPSKKYFDNASYDDQDSPNAFLQDGETEF